MRRVPTLDLIRNFSVYSDEAISGPLIVTKSGRDRLVLLNIEQYEEMKRAYDSLIADAKDSDR